MVTAGGSGSYTIEGADTDKPRIVLQEITTGHAPGVLPNQKRLKLH